MISLGQLKHIASTDPKLYEVLKQLVDNHNHFNILIGLDTSGQVATPPKISSLVVTAANGVFRATITDKSSISRGIVYFLEHDTTPTFATAVTESLGPSRGWIKFLGSATFYFRAYSQYQLSPQKSTIVYFGTPAAPTGVAGGGAIAGPAPLPSQGSGTSAIPGYGYGNIPNQKGPFTGYK